MQYLIGLALIVFLGWLAVKLVIWLAPKLLTGVIVTLGAGSVVGVFVGIYYGIANYFTSIRENITNAPLKIGMSIITILSSLILVAGFAYALVVGGRNIIDREILEKVESYKSDGIRYITQKANDAAVNQFTLAIEELKHYDNSLLLALNELQAKIEPEKLLARQQEYNRVLALLHKLRGMAYIAEQATKVGDDFIVTTFLPQKKLPTEILNLAIKDLSVAIILDKQNPAYYRERSRVYILKNDYDKAIEDLQAVLRINPQYPNAVQDLSQAMLLKAKQKPARRN